MISCTMTPPREGLWYDVTGRSHRKGRLHVPAHRTLTSIRRISYRDLVGSPSTSSRHDSAGLSNLQ